MSLLLLRIMLGLGIIGHALNMYCDRILCIFPNGTINFSNIKEITEGDAGSVKYCIGFTSVCIGVSGSPRGIRHCCRHRCDRIPHLGIDFYDPSHCHCNVPV